MVKRSCEVAAAIEAGEAALQKLRDPQAEIFRVFGGTSLPRTVVLDAMGVVRDVHSGSLTAAELTQKLQQQGLLPAT